MDSLAGGPAPAGEAAPAAVRPESEFGTGEGAARGRESSRLRRKPASVS